MEGAKLDEDGNVVLQLDFQLASATGGKSLTWLSSATGCAKHKLGLKWRRS